MIKVVYLILSFKIPVTLAVFANLDNLFAAECIACKMYYAVIFIFFHSKSFAAICFWSSSNDGKRTTFIHEHKHTVPQSLQSARLCLFLLEHREKQSTRICF